MQNDEIDLVRGPGYVAYTLRHDDHYKYIPDRDKNLSPDQAKPQPHPFADADEFARHPAVIHRILDAAWANDREVSLVDIGAYIGGFSLDLGSFARARKKSLPMALFEPGITYELCRQNAEMNGFTDATVINKAVGDKPGLADFVVPHGYANASRMLEIDQDGLAARADIKQVEILDIIDVLKKFGSSDLTLIKIDAEGLDRRLLMRMADYRDIFERCVIVFEYTPRLYSYGERLEMLRRMSRTHSIRNIGLSTETKNHPLIDPKELSAFAKKMFEDQTYYTDMLLQPSPLRPERSIIERIGAGISKVFGR